MKNLIAPRLTSLLLTSLLCSLPTFAKSALAEVAKPAMHHAHLAHEVQPAKLSKYDTQMKKLSQEFLQAWWGMQGEYALYVGNYASAAELIPPTAQEHARQLKFDLAWLARLEKVDDQQLSAGYSTDLALMKNALQNEIWYLHEAKEYQWNPSNYNIAGAFDVILNTDYAPKRERLLSLLQRLKNVPAYYAAVRTETVNPVAEYTELAIVQTAGTFQMLQDAKKAADDSDLSAAQKQLFAQRVQAAKEAVEQHTAWLHSLLAKGEAKRSFRLGKELYESKFALQIQSGLTGEQTYHLALDAKEAMLARMEKLSDELWPKYMAGVAKPAERTEKIGMLINTLSAQHAKPEDFVSEVRRQLPLLQKWVVEKNLLGQDASKPLEVRDTPLYQRGVTIASISAPGPYRPQDPTYYNVSPLTEMTPAQAESHLREYNHWILQVLSIHEAIPGHYTQLVYANRSPSLIKSIFGNGTMIEGWAVYGELMMMESGWGENTPEMWLMYSKWNLRTICNTLLDYGVHVQGMKEEQALHLLMKEAFQSETEARGKWRRVQLSSVQLASYFSGFSAIMALREEQRKQLGSAFDLKKFHEQFLSYGSAPVPMIRRLMQGKPASIAAHHEKIDTSASSVKPAHH